MNRLALVLLILDLSACGGDGSASNSGFSPGTMHVPDFPDTSSGISSSGQIVHDVSTSGSTLEPSESSEGIVWDMGMPDFGATQPAGCAGKIDFLFSVSADGTMVESQGRLVAAFPGFMKAIKEQLSDFDVHVMITNPYGDIWNIEDCGMCMDAEDCDPAGQPPTCGAVATTCDNVHGAGLTFPRGLYASNERCQVASERGYLVSGEDDLMSSFSCMAQVGTHGGSRTAEMMVKAISPELNDPKYPNPCNMGFLRGDALLVVTIIQDTYDSKSMNTVYHWTEALRAAKHGDDDAFMVLVLTTDVDLGYQQLCHPNDYLPYKNRLRLLAEGVKHGFVGSICMDSYVPFFEEHVAHLVELCDTFVPK